MEQDRDPEESSQSTAIETLRGTPVSELTHLPPAMAGALDRLRRMIGFTGQWTDLSVFLPDGWSNDPKRRRSATAATFAASLELARQGRLEIRQAETFAPIHYRQKPHDDRS